MQSEKLSKSVKIKFVIAYPLHHNTIIAKPLHFILFKVESSDSKILDSKAAHWAVQLTVNGTVII